MWTVVLATYAAVVSTASLAMAYISYRAGGPRLSGEAYIMGRYDIQGPTLHVNLYNRGRAPITVDHVWVWGLAKTLGKERPVCGWGLGGAAYEEVRIEGHSGKSWSFPAVGISEDWLTRAELTRIEVAVSRADGPKLILKVDTENIDALDKDNLPDWQPDHFARRPTDGKAVAPADEGGASPADTAN